jgi:hypothetical protein
MPQLPIRIERNFEISDPIDKAPRSCTVTVYKSSETPSALQMRW